MNWKNRPQRHIYFDIVKIS